MSYEQILTRVSDGILTITMNRPDRLNAWTPHMAGEMADAIRKANDDPDVEGIVITGAGRGFCAGADIEAVFKAQAEGDGATARSGRRVGNWVELIRASKPVVAAINGPSVGVGLTQVLCADRLIAARGAKLSARFIKMGLVPELASSQYLVLRCGLGNASDLMLTGKTILADEAQSIGLVDEVVEPEALLDAAHAAAKAMGENPQAAIRMVKALITQNASEADVKAVMRRESEALAKCYESAEHKEAIAAFMEKRTPDFRAARRAET